MADLLQPLPLFLSSPLPKPSLNSSPGPGVGRIQLPLAGVMGQRCPSLCQVCQFAAAAPTVGSVHCVSIENPLWLTALGSSVARWNGCCASRQGWKTLTWPLWATAFPLGSNTLAIQSACVLWDMPRALQPGVTLCRIRPDSSAGSTAHPTGAVNRGLTAEPELLQLGYF